MPYVSPGYHINDLRARLHDAGWTVEPVECDETQWWLHTLWRLHSSWRPVGTSAYLGFVGDPGDHKADKAGDIILGRTMPMERQVQATLGFQFFPLSPNWDAERGKLIDALARLRD